MKGIITADWHLRLDIPRCRNDADWIQTQKDAVQFVIDTANELGCDLFLLGDIFNTPRVPAEILSIILGAVTHLKGKLFIIAGQHDLPYHNLNMIENSTFGNLVALQNWTGSKIIKMRWDNFGAYDYGYHGYFDSDSEREIIFIHKLIFPSKKDVPPDVEAVSAGEMLTALPKTKWLFSGDYHLGYHFQMKEQHVVMPGCLTIQAADLIDYKPKVYYVDTDQDVVKPVFLPEQFNSVVNDSYLTEVSEREERINAFVEAVKGNEGLTLDFIDNLLTLFSTIGDDVKNIINKLIQGVKNE